jgi:hypothetical protein
MDVMFNTWHTEPRRRWQTDKAGYIRSQAKSKKAEAFGRKHNVDSCNSVSCKALAALDLLLMTYARVQLPPYTTSYRLALLSAIALADDLLSHSNDALGYGSLPPTYDDAINDLPPEYSTLPEQAEANPSSPESAPPPPCRKSYQDQKKSPVSSLIDFDGTSTFRQHGKKQKAKLAAKSTPAGGAPTGNGGGGKKDDEPAGGGDKAGGNGAGSGGGDDNGGGGGGDGNEEPWDDFTTSTSKKKKSKKKEEEEERKKKEEEAAAANSGGNNLSWADDLEGGNGDDTWAGFTSVSKNDKKKKDLVSVVFPVDQDIFTYC